MTTLSRARLTALLVPALLLLGALGSQYIGHLVPCEMCMRQRWPHLAAIVLALLAILLRPNPKASRGFTLLAALAILVSGLIGVYHVGVEYHWWTGITRCTAPVLGGSGQDILAQIMAERGMALPKVFGSVFGRTRNRFDAQMEGDGSADEITSTLDRADGEPALNVEAGTDGAPPVDDARSEIRGLMNKVRQMSSQFRASRGDA